MLVWNIHYISQRYLIGGVNGFIVSVVASVALSTVNAEEIKGRGASFPGPVYKAWTSEYFTATGNKVNYTPTGSGDGIKSIKKRMVDFTGSDKPLKEDKLAKAKHIK